MLFVGIVAGILQTETVSGIIKEMYFELQKYAAEGKNIQEYIYAVLAIGTFSLLLFSLLFFMFVPKTYIGWFFPFVFLVLLSGIVLAGLSEVYKDEIVEYLKTGYVPKQDISEKAK